MEREKLRLLCEQRARVKVLYSGFPYCRIQPAYHKLAHG